jgi:hypothetical protein
MALVVHKTFGCDPDSACTVLFSLETNKFASMLILRRGSTFVRTLICFRCSSGVFFATRLRIFHR